MPETERKTFTVETIGVGQPDYSQPEIVAERALSVVFPEREIAGKKYGDFAKISFTGTQQEYVIGTNANAAKSGSWPSTQVAKEIQFYATTTCHIRINDSDAVPQEVPANLPIRFFRRCTKFYVYQDSSPGTLYVWIEG
jgi:hypothetical protein